MGTVQHGFTGDNLSDGDGDDVNNYFDNDRADYSILSWNPNWKFMTKRDNGQLTKTTLFVSLVLMEMLLWKALWCPAGDFYLPLITFKVVVMLSKVLTSESNCFRRMRQAYDCHSSCESLHIIWRTFLVVFFSLYGLVTSVKAPIDKAANVLVFISGILWSLFILCDDYPRIE